ncbi:MAG TPA: hypothetical protein VL241_06965 [Gemmatimonadales bacterium]|nr:hypothetical protein [Gemmatimonadales bacterium]
MMQTVRRALAALALTAGVAAAQQPAAPDISKQLLGTWEGPYQSEAAPPGSLRLTIAKGDKGEWKVTMIVLSDQPPPTGDIQEFTVQGNSLSWSQDIADMQCKSTAQLVAGVLKGTAECSQGGAVALTATFLLGKQP